MRGVDAFDVESRVGLGIAALLRFRQDVRERRPGRTHLRQDEIAGSVDDARDPFDAVRGQAFAQRLDDRDAAGDRRLESNHHAGLLRGREDFVAVRGEQRLVGGDDVLAMPDRREHQRLGGLDAADQLDDDVDFRMGDERREVRRQLHIPGAGQGKPCTFERARRDPIDADRPPRAPRDFLRVAIEHVPGAASDRAHA